MTPCLFPQFDAGQVSHWLAGLRADNADVLVLAFLPETEMPRVGDLQSLCSEHSVELLGAIFPALIDGAGFRTEGVLLLALPASATHFLVADIDCAPAPGASRIAAALPASSETGEKPENLFLILDSMLPDTSTLLVHLFARLGHRYRYSGVNAGSETFRPQSCLFDNHRLLGQGALGIVLPANREIWVEHGYPVSKSLMRATSTQGNRIDKIDGKPAMSVYQQVIGEEYGIALTQDNFYDYAVHYPFGLIGSLEVLIRIPVAFNADGSIFCVGEVPPDAMLRLIRAPSLEENTCIDLLAGHLGQSAAPLLTFYCAGRRMHFGDQAGLELAELQQKSGARQQFGALSLGEIATDAELGIPEFHNAALVCLR